MHVSHSREVCIKQAILEHNRRVGDICIQIERDLAARGLHQVSFSPILRGAYDSVGEIINKVIDCDIAAAKRQLARIRVSGKVTESFPFSEHHIDELSRTVTEVLEDIPINLKMYSQRFTPEDQSELIRIKSHDAQQRIQSEYFALESAFQLDVKAILEARDAERARSHRAAVTQEELLEVVAAQPENKGIQEKTNDNGGASKYEKTKSESQAVDDKHPDGPEPPNLLWVNGEQYEIALIPWRLINHMWGRDKDEESEVTLAVWSEQITDAALRTTINRANNEMSKVLFNRKLYTKAGYVCWKEGS